MHRQILDAKKMLQVASDMEFLSELQQQRKASGMHEAEILTVRFKQLTQYLNGIKPVIANCVVCAKKDPSTWKDARVDTMRKQVHCLRHKAIFHSNDQGVKNELACISCDDFDPNWSKIHQGWLENVLGPKGKSAVVNNDELFDIDENVGDENLSKAIARHEQALTVFSEVKVEYLDAKGQLTALRRRHKTAKLRMLCTQKELTLARIELLQMGVENPGESYLGKRRRYILEGSETESEGASEFETPPIFSDPEGENEDEDEPEPEVDQE